MTSFVIGQFALFVVLAVIAAVSDLRNRTIPNWINGIVFVLGIAGVLLVAGSGALPSHMLHFGIALVIGIVLFALGLWGGGDAKFYAAMAVWFGFHDMLDLIVAIAIAGGGLAVVWFLVNRARKIPFADSKARGLPYGVAISIGGIFLKIMELRMISDPVSQLKAF